MLCRIGFLVGAGALQNFQITKPLVSPMLVSFCIPIRDLLVQSRQWKHHGTMCKIFSKFTTKTIEQRY